jgi:REP element-mobilizing transposase RayT
MTYANTPGYKIRNQTATHFLTFTIVGWIDLFSRQRYRDIILENMAFCRKEKGLLQSAYVIMSNHLHLIWTSRNKNMSGLIRDFKGYTSKRLIESIQKDPESRRDWLLYMFRYHAKYASDNEEFKLWTGDNHPEEIHSAAFFATKLNYIHQNPVRAGLVADPTSYIYSSAANYKGRKGLIDVDVLHW